MARRKNKRKKTARTGGGRQVYAPKGCLAIIPIDEVPIRRNAEKKYKSVLQRMRKAVQQEEDYESQDKPAFEVWKHREFGPELTRIQDLYHEQTALNKIVHNVFYTAAMSRSDPVECYARAMGWEAEKPAEAETEAPPEEAPRGSKSSAPGTGRAGGEAHAPDEEEEEFDPFEEFFANFFRFMNDGPMPGHPQSKGDGTEKELKAVYRRLVLRLHPDHGEPIERREELWHQVQTAYRERNLSDLLHIEAGLDRKVHVNELHHWRISDLLAMTRRQEYDLRDIQARLRIAKRTPQWGFAQMSAVERQFLRLNVQTELLDLRRQIEHSLNLLKEQTDQWEKEYHARKAAPPPVPKPARKQSKRKSIPNDPRQMECPF